MNYTPGPWTIESPDEPYGDIRVRGDDRNICALWQDDAPEHTYNAEQWANAQLIAAAPALRDALAGLVEAITKGYSDHDGSKIRAACDALNLADGFEV